MITPVITRIWLRKPDKRRPHPQIVYYLDNGDTHYLTIRGTLDDARKRYQYEKSAIALGDNSASKWIPKYNRFDMRFLEFSEVYLRELWEKVENPLEKLSLHTFRTTRTAMKKFYRVMGDLKVGEISVADVETFKRRLAGYRKPSTINCYIDRLATIFGRLVRNGQLPANPFERMRSPLQSGREAARFFNDEELDRLHAHFDNHPNEMYRFLFLFLIYTGCRVGGLKSARRRDIVWYPAEGMHFITLLEKGNKRREIPIPGELWPHIERRIEILSSPAMVDQALRVCQYRRDLWESCRRQAAEGYLVFELTSVISITNILRLQIRAAGIERGSAHWLRHTFSRIYLENGGDLKRLKEHLGHESIVTTDRIYGHISRRAKSRDIDRLTFRRPEKATGE